MGGAGGTRPPGRYRRGPDARPDEGLHRPLRARRQRPRLVVRWLAPDLRQRLCSASPPEVCGQRGRLAPEGAGFARTRGQAVLTGRRPSVLLYDWDNTLVDGW